MEERYPCFKSFSPMLSTHPWCWESNDHCLLEEFGLFLGFWSQCSANATMASHSSHGSCSGPQKPRGAEGKRGLTITLLILTSVIRTAVRRHHWHLLLVHQLHFTWQWVGGKAGGLFGTSLYIAQPHLRTPAHSAHSNRLSLFLTWKPATSGT